MAAKSGDYYVFPETGSIQQQRDPVLAALLKAAGWAGPFPTMAAAHAAINSTGVQKVKDANGLGPVTSTTQALAKIGGFFEALAHLNTWTSLGWIAGGVILALAGLLMLVRPSAPPVLPVPV